MTTDTFMTAAIIAVVASVTWAVRGLPYLVFGGKKEIPKTVSYLSTVLPASIMIILVVYCLREVKLTTFPYGITELISVLVVIIAQFWKRNNFLSIFLGTACYMILVRVIN